MNPIDRTSIFLGEKISYVFLASVIITAYEVIMRYGFNAPTTWVHDGATALSATGFLVAGCYCLQKRRHIAITVIYDSVSPGLRRTFAFINALIIALFMCLLTWATLKIALNATWMNWNCEVQFCGLETSAHAWDVPVPAYLKTVLFLASVIMLLQALVQLVTVVQDFFKKTES
ncbi:MAG: TRAP transporter small permease [Pseudomonadota bacterium]|nr:TRAP transporter small permease [Pseudomonadota bacterium]